MRYFHSITIQFASDLASTGTLKLGNIIESLCRTDVTVDQNSVRAECVTSKLSDKK